MVFTQNWQVAEDIHRGDISGKYYQAPLPFSQAFYHLFDATLDVFALGS